MNKRLSLKMFKSYKIYGLITIILVIFIIISVTIAVIFDIYPDWFFRPELYFLSLATSLIFLIKYWHVKNNSSKAMKVVVLLYLFFGLASLAMFLYPYILFLSCSTGLIDCGPPIPMLI